MALSVSSLAAALSQLSLPSTSTSKPHPAPLLRLRSTSRRAASLALRASAAEAAEPSEADLPAEEVVAVEEEAEEDALSGIALRKYVKQRLPGGFAAQRITATGRRKTAIARVVLQEGTGKVFINFRDAKVPVNPRNARTDCTNVAPLCCLGRIAICSTIPANLQLEHLKISGDELNRCGQNRAAQIIVTDICQCAYYVVLIVVTTKTLKLCCLAVRLLK